MQRGHPLSLWQFPGLSITPETRCPDPCPDNLWFPRAALSRRHETVVLSLQGELQSRCVSPGHICHAFGVSSLKGAPHA